MLAFRRRQSMKPGIRTLVVSSSFDARFIFTLDVVPSYPDDLVQDDVGQDAAAFRVDGELLSRPVTEVTELPQIRVRRGRVVLNAATFVPGETVPPHDVAEFVR